MNIELNDRIIVRYIDDKFLKFLQQEFVIDNPEYITRKKLNKWRGNTPKKLYLYEMYNQDMVRLPYGSLYKVMAFVMENYDPSSIYVETHLNGLQQGDWSNCAELMLRDYQQTAIDEMVNWYTGILKSPCSSGKTIMGHALAKRLGQKTLWLTHTKDLLNQSKAVGELLLGSERIGTITEGKVNIGSTITYATVQTMAQLDYEVYRNEFDVVIVDECHRINSKHSYSQFAYVVNHTAATYKYGLSATPETFDGYGKTIMMNIGDIRFVIDKDVLEDNNTIMPVKIQRVFTNWEYPEEAYQANGVVDFHAACKQMAFDDERNEQIISLLNGKPTMILSNSIEMLCGLMNHLTEEQQTKSCLLTTKHDESLLTAKGVLRSHTSKQREMYLEMLRKGELDYMFSTYQLAKEGLNIPRIEQVVMAFPAVNPNIITQVIGRVARTCEGKTEAICYDVVDRPKYFRRKYTDRMKLYRAQGNEVI